MEDDRGLITRGMEHQSAFAREPFPIGMAFLPERVHFAITVGLLTCNRRVVEKREDEM